MTLPVLLLFVLGGALLVAGAELLVRGASRLAIAAGISPLVVGLTVVAFGTSAPELAVTINAAASGQADVALGNVVGSNIFNVLFILGVSALIAPLVVSQHLVRLHVPVMIVSSLLVLVLALDGAVGRLEGATLFAMGVGYTIFLVRASHRETAAAQAGQTETVGEAPPTAVRRSWLRDAALIAIGLALLVAGARWLVEGAVSMAVALGMSELVIGLTIVAAGTSLPEVATSVLASIRGERDIAVGNVVGSNIFNILIVLGAGAAISPVGVAVASGALAFDIPVMIAVAVACLPVFFTGHLIARWEGVLFLAYYVAYTVLLILQASGSPAAPPLRAAMLTFVLPLTAVTLVLLVVRAVRRDQRANG